MKLIISNEVQQLCEFNTVVLRLYNQYNICMIVVFRLVFKKLRKGQYVLVMQDAAGVTEGQI